MRAIALTCKVPDFPYIAVCKLCIRTLFATLYPFRMCPRSVASFGFGIKHIVGMRTGEQVVRAHASRRIAMMAYIKTIRYRAISKFVGEAVRGFQATVYPQLSVPIRRQAGTSPEPTGISLFDLLPKAVNARYNVHADSSNQGLAVPRVVTATPRFSMPNYTTNGGAT
jgi:hypothetical protein